VVDYGTCHAFLYACTQIFGRPSNSLCNHSMRAAEDWKALIPLCAKNSAESSGVKGWLLIRSCATLAFSRTTSLRVSYGAHVTISSAPSITCKKVFFVTLISIPHHVVNSCTMSSKVCIPSGVSAKFQMSSIKPMLLN